MTEVQRNGKDTEHVLPMVDFNSEAIICQKFHSFKRKRKLNSNSKACSTKYNSTIYMLFSQG